MATPSIDDLLRSTVEMEASDLLIKAESPPMVRVHGDLQRLDMPVLSEEESRAISYSILSEERIARFERELELDLAYAIPGLARFRVNLFLQRGMVGSAYRTIPLRIQSMEELNLPPVCREFASRPRGLVLVTGPTGSGKTTSLAAMIRFINERDPLHIMTVEDPIEFVYEDQVSLINQRELGDDTHSFAAALKFVLRQDPDVILVGEMRDLETIGLAITAAETGHLVFGTLHTTDAVQTVDRIIDVFPTYQQQQVRMQLSVNLVGVMSQTLVRRADGQGRVAAFETLVAIPSIRNLIREAKTFQIGSMIQTGARTGMFTLDQNLGQLVRQRVITEDDAMAKAQNVRELQAILDEQRKSAGQPSRAAAS
jgi:twitching motility protein PilT